MEEIQHKYVDVRGLKRHVAEIGTGPVVVFLHGFPEIWYSWRHQMVAAAKTGFRAITRDYRGYGLSEQPAEPEKATFRDLVDDLLAILDSFEIAKENCIDKEPGRAEKDFALTLGQAWFEDYGVTALKVAAPSLLIMGEKDYALKFGNLAEYISGGVVKQYVPNLEVTYLQEGSHFVQEQFPDQVNSLILAFLNKHK
ncbi:hypothetical protein RJ639_046030 [Escallonia herrerae]|uniref:AB hydrolase-1 domain-containing protein n=1 Tax=Escallonia herrerae TaxID=1293975 RepID=A0AA88W778_9ASTE|nr:hypothetical protein RJ639_046030 [Escallonia herrerae]